VDVGVFSRVNAIYNGTQAGTANEDIAVIWQGTANSVFSLNSPGRPPSEANGIWGNEVAGTWHVPASSDLHAALWTDATVSLDLYMPEMDGAGLLEIMRSFLRLQSVPVIVCGPDCPTVLWWSGREYLRINDILVKSKATFDDILHAVEMALVRAPG
jgi:hypothetical protein